MASALRVLLVDDQELIVKALSALIMADGAALGVDVVGTASSAKTAVMQASALMPDLILMDMHMPDINGDEAVRTIKRQFPETKILMLSGFDSLQDVCLAKAAGADGYAYKNDSATSLISAIQGVMSGEQLFVSRYDDEQLKASKPFGLTRRQIQVLKMLMQGAHNKDIAVALSISIRTVEKHRKFLMDKLNNPNPAQLSQVAHDMGLTNNIR